MDSYIINLDSSLITGIIFQLISVGILCAILILVLYKPVIRFLDARKLKIQNRINEANSKLDEADALKFEYEIKLKEIENEKASILEEAHNKAKANEARILEEAKKDAAAIKSRAMLDIEREQEKAKEEIRLQIIEVSSLLANKFISKNINEDEQKQLIDNIIADLEEVKWEN